VARKVLRADEYVRAQSGWDRDQFTGNELSGKVLGIVGLGNVGKKIAKRGAGFEMSLLGFDPFIDKTEMAGYGVTKVDALEELLPQADFVTVHVPLTDSTHRFIGERELNRMKNTAVLINTSRGTVVDQRALVKALKNREIGGAGLDVFETEPPDDSELLGLENIVVSPHIAGTTHEALQKMTFQAAEILIENLK
jgi:D-3-phosphoglycerate dehydrogenase